MQMESSLFFHLGDPEMTLNSWLGREIVPRDPEKIQEEAHKKFLALNKFLKS